MGFDGAIAESSKEIWQRNQKIENNNYLVIVSRNNKYFHLRKFFIFYNFYYFIVVRGFLFSCAAHALCFPTKQKTPA